MLNKVKLGKIVHNVGYVRNGPKIKLSNKDCYETYGRLDFDH